MNNQYTLRDFLNEIEEEKIAGAKQMPGFVQDLGGQVLKKYNPVMTAVSVASSAKQTAGNAAIKQGHADDIMGVSGRFNKVAFITRKNKSKDKDNEHSNLYKQPKRRLNSKERALIASGATLAGLGLYGSMKHKDPLWAAKTINKNKKPLAAKAVGNVIKHSPFKDAAREVNRAVQDEYGVFAPKGLKDGDIAGKVDDMVRGGNKSNLLNVFGLSAAMMLGKNTGDLVYNGLLDRVKAKKLALKEQEQRQADEVSSKLKAEDLFKKASIATGDDIVTAVNKSVEKFLPEEIKKRQDRRNRYNTTVDYVDHGAHGGDAPQRRNK